MFFVCSVVEDCAAPAVSVVAVMALHEHPFVFVQMIFAIDSHMQCLIAFKH